MTSILEQADQYRTDVDSVLQWAVLALPHDNDDDNQNRQGAYRSAQERGFPFRQSSRCTKKPGQIDQLMERSRAARTVCSNSVVMVIGPTPPGTGVMYDALRDAESKSTSPLLSA